MNRYLFLNAIPKSPFSYKSLWRVKPEYDHKYAGYVILRGVVEKKDSQHPKLDMWWCDIKNASDEHTSRGQIKHTDLMKYFIHE